MNDPEKKVEKTKLTLNLPKYFHWNMNLRKLDGWLMFRAKPLNYEQKSQQH